MKTQFVYLASAALFILSIKWMSQVRSSRRGNWAGSLAMLLAVAGTLAYTGITSTSAGWVAGSIALGAIIGIPMAVFMPMTAVPQRTALSHAFGGLAAGLVGTAEYLQYAPHINHFAMGALATEMLLGYLTFTGSMLAFGKLQELIPTQPIIYPLRNVISILTLLVAIGSGVFLTMHPENATVMWVLMGSSLLFGILLVLPIGGADMPTVIAILNSYAGLSACAMGFVMNNKLLIIAGALDGSSGLILSILMCKAMNRSFANVLFAGVGQVIVKAQTGGPVKQVKAYTVEDAVSMLDGARMVIIVPGYGLAVAQAQHAVKELAAVLTQRGTQVKFAVHPVAGRMPGHMNVLLAEADVAYDDLLELEHVNPLFPEADMAIVLGANDVVNPAARHDKSSPIYGMPILDVDKARSVMVVKRSMNPGFAGVDNELFYLDNTMMVFGDAKKVVMDMVADFKRIAA
ncbi:MAG TPA: NAD(P)(+) transhydrogenase (Re/Si-specific) subunit beta [Kofleriaceae bacterium]